MPSTLDRPTKEPKPYNKATERFKPHVKPQPPSLPLENLNSITNGICLKSYNATMSECPEYRSVIPLKRLYDLKQSDSVPRIGDSEISYCEKFEDSTGFQAHPEESDRGGNNQHSGQRVYYTTVDGKVTELEGGNSLQELVKQGTLSTKDIKSIAILYYQGGWGANGDYGNTSLVVFVKKKPYTSNNLSK